MIVLDTNVLSEILRPEPLPVVTGWLALQPADTTFTTAITEAEMLRGVAMLPSGRRRSLLAAAMGKIFAHEFAGRVLPFDEDCAAAYAEISAARARSGRPISQPDAMIAAICRSRHAAIATRNTADFERCGVRLLNPWNA